MDDQMIILLYWKRDEKAIAETEAKYGDYCYSIAYRILDNNEDAEESVNDTYNAAWNSMPPHRPSVLSSFLGKITRRIAIDKFRYRTAQKRGGGEMPLALDELLDCVASDEAIDKELERQRLSDIINRFVLSLPTAEKRCFFVAIFT